jgi:hypothetical protein
MYSTGYCCQMLMKFEFSRQIFEKTQIPNFMKISAVSAESFHADRRTDVTKLTVAFRNFANVPKKCDVGAVYAVFPSPNIEKLNFDKHADTRVIVTKYGRYCFPISSQKWNGSIKLKFPLKFQTFSKMILVSKFSKLTNHRGLTVSHFFNSLVHLHDLFNSGVISLFLHI